MNTYITKAMALALIVSASFFQVRMSLAASITKEAFADEALTIPITSVTPGIFYYKITVNTLNPESSISVIDNLPSCITIEDANDIRAVNFTKLVTFTSGKNTFGFQASGRELPPTAIVSAKVTFKENCAACTLTNNVSLKIDNMQVDSTTNTLNSAATPVQIIGKTNICADSTLTLCAQPIDCTTAPALKYQWFFKDQLLMGECNPCLRIKNAQVTDSGVYRVIVTDCDGIPCAAEAKVTVTDCPRLAVSKCVTITESNTLRYDIEVRNTSGVVAHNLRLSDNLPDCLEITGVDAQGWDPVSDAPNLKLHLTSLAPNVPSTITIFATRKDDGDCRCIKNTVTVKADHARRKSATNCICFEEDQK